MGSDQSEEAYQISHILKQLVPIINDMQAGVIKLGDLVNSVARAPTVEEFKVINLFLFIRSIYSISLHTALLLIIL